MRKMDWFLVPALLVLFFLVLFWAGTAVASPGQEKTYVDHWNTCVNSLKEEFPEGGWGEWETLLESYQNEPPDMVRSLDRTERLKRLVAVEKRRVKALEELLKIEGKD